MCTHSAELECELRERDDKISELRHALASLDKDHTSEVAEKSETVALLNREMEERERSLSEAQSRMAQLEGETAHVKGQLEQGVMETTKLRSQLEEGGKEVGELRSHCETLAREENQLREDLSTMTQVFYLLHIACVPHYIKGSCMGYVIMYIPLVSIPHFYVYYILSPLPPFPGVSGSTN